MFISKFSLLFPSDKTFVLDWQLVRWLGFLFLEYHGSNSSKLSIKLSIYKSANREEMDDVLYT
jgi:hypothetical protein